MPLRLIAEEYVKYLAAGVGLDRHSFRARARGCLQRPRRMSLLRSVLFNMYFFAATFLMTTVPGTYVRLVAPERVLGVAQLWARLIVAACA